MRSKKNSYNQYVIDKYGMTEVKNLEKKWFICFTYTNLKKREHLRKNIHRK